MSQVVRVAWYRFRTTFRRRRGGYVAIVLLIGLLGGLAMAAVAGARRTQSSFPTFLASTNPSDLVVEPFGVGGVDNGIVGALARLPHVTSASRLALPNAGLLRAGHRTLVPTTVSLLASADDMFFARDRAVAVDGRVANAKRPDEMMLTADAAHALHVRVGDELHLGFWPADTDDGPARFATGERVVGIVVLNKSLVQDDADRFPAIAVLTPALTRRLEQRCAQCMFPRPVIGFQVDDARNVTTVEHEIEAALPRQNYPLVELLSIVETKALRAIKPASIALGLFGIIAALATLVIAGQVIGRQLRFGADDLPVLRALGANPAMTAADGLVGVIGAIGLGGVAAVGVAVALSPLAPVGLVRPVYPTRGFAIDRTALGFGFATLVVVLTAWAVAVAIRQAPHRAGQRAAVRRGSRVARAAAAAGLPAPAVSGVRLALEPGRGRNAVPVRSALVATTLAVAIAVSTLVFGSSLRTLVSRPALYGWNWSYALQAANNGPIPPDARAALDRSPAVAAWNGVVQVPLVHIDDQLVPAFAVPPDSPLTPPILTGHAIDGPDQMVIGTATLARLHKRVGDTVVATLGRPKDAPLWIAPARFRIVGAATFPTVGFIGEQNTSMSTGAWIADTDQPRNRAMKELRVTLYGALSGPTMALVRLRPGTSPSDGRATLQRIADRANADPKQRDGGWTISVLGPQRPAEIVNYRSMGSTPILLAGALAAGAIVALALTLVASVRRRRRDLALLKTIGFTRRQLASTVAAQASVAAIVGIVIGVPLGLFAGRWLWTLFAHSISAVPEPSVPVLAVVLVGVATLVFAVLVAAIPGRQAARTPSALLLRAE